MRAVLIAGLKSDHQQQWAGAFGEGLKRHGYDVLIRTKPEPCDLLVMWSVRRQDRIKEQLASGGEVCILERGYLGDRHEWTSVSFGGGLNGLARFRGPFEDGSRFKRLFGDMLKPWKPGGNVALVMKQVPGDMSLCNVDADGFYQRAIARFFALGYDVRVRPHPMTLGALRGRPLQDDLRDASIAITWNSNSGVDAVLAGVPTVAMDRGSMAYPVTGHEFAVPPTPDRTAWASRLAWCQWSLDEMRSGQCWDLCGRQVEMAL